jgi:hypothetical protein
MLIWARHTEWSRRTEEALAALQRALDRSSRHQQRGYEAWVLYPIGKVNALLDPADVGSAHQRYSEAMALADELEMRRLSALCHLGTGMLGAQASSLQYAPAAAQHRSGHVP